MLHGQGLALGCPKASWVLHAACLPRRLPGLPPTLRIPEGIVGVGGRGQQGEEACAVTRGVQHNTNTAGFAGH